MRLNAWRIAEPEAEWARDLVRQDWLTPCQANQLNRWHTADLVIGQYVVLDRLGGGCMGDVYKVRRFEREPDALARLSHPDIVTLHDAGADNGRLYLVLRTTDGIVKILDLEMELWPRTAAGDLTTQALTTQ